MVDLSEALLILIFVGVAAFYAWYAFPVIRKKPVTGAESLVGAKGMVYSERLDSEGEVSIDGVIWRACLAKATAGPLKRGDAVTVKAVEDLTLIIDASAKLAKTS